MPKSSQLYHRRALKLNNDYKYLSGLSQEAQEIIINRAEQGEVNLYHSIMSVLGGRKQRESIKDCEAEKKHYRLYSKRNTDLTGISKPLFDEIFNFTYARFMEKEQKEHKKHRTDKQPLTSKNNMLIAKGAMILALEKCNVSEKNITGMVGVIDAILHDTSEIKLKAAYENYIEAHQEAAKETK